MRFARIVAVVSFHIMFFINRIQIATDRIGIESTENRIYGSWEVMRIHIVLKDLAAFPGIGERWTTAP